KRCGPDATIVCSTQLFHHPLRVAYQPDIQAESAGDFAGIDIDADEFCILTEARRSHMPEHVIDARADDQHQIGLSKGYVARCRKTVFVIFRNRAAALRRCVEWDATLFDKRP